jgi:hypothetical protein
MTRPRIRSRRAARSIAQAARRRRGDTSVGAYAVFYGGIAIGVGLLTYAGFFLSTPPSRISQHYADSTPRVATIQLAHGDGKGQCRQVIFDNATGNFEDIGLSRCRNLIPDELLVDTVQSRAAHTTAFSRAFKR